MIRDLMRLPVVLGVAALAAVGAARAQSQCPGETAHTCTTCHDMTHRQVKACTDCHAKDLHLLLHPTGLGTPLEDPARACLACHMPGGFHPFPPVEPAVDLTLVCGQCHGAGAVGAATTGTIASGSQALTVADPTGFATGQQVTVAGADLVCAQSADLATWVGVVDGSQVTLVDSAGRSVTDAAVTISPTHNNAAAFTLEQLTAYAAAIHNDAPAVAFSYSYGNPNTLQVNVDASTSLCSGSNASCDLYDWDWGDATAHGSGRTTSHTYAAAGTYSIQLTVTQCGVQSGTVTVPVNVSAPDFPPTLSAACTFNVNTWAVTVVDASQDDHGVKQVSVNWGDNSVVASQTIANPQPNTPTNLTFTHTYLLPPTAPATSYTVTESVYDTIGQRTTSALVCTPPVAPAYFTVSGYVYQSNGTTPVPTALVQVRIGSTVRQAYTSASGSYAIGLLKPGSYTLTVTKAGYTFPAASGFTLGPSPSITVKAVSP